MRHHVIVEPVRILAWDAELKCERLRGIGYRASCLCGAKTRVFPRHATARAATGFLVHVGEDHGTSSEAK